MSLLCRSTSSRGQSVETVEIPQLQLVDCGHCRSHARRCAKKGDEWFRRPENCEGPAVAVHLHRVVDVPVVQVLLAQFIDNLTEWRLWRWGWGFWRFFRIFRAPPGCPGVERQFSEPSTTKSSS